MKKLLLLVAAVGLLAASFGCAYTAMTADPNGKVYITRANMMGLWNSAWVCDPNAGQLNCQEATFEGAGGAPVPQAAPAAPPASPEPAPAPMPEEGEDMGGGEEGM